MTALYLFGDCRALKGRIVGMELRPSTRQHIQGPTRDFVKVKSQFISRSFNARNALPTDLKAMKSIQSAFICTSYRAERNLDPNIPPNLLYDGENTCIFSLHRYRSRFCTFLDSTELRPGYVQKCWNVLPGIGFLPGWHLRNIMSASDAPFLPRLLKVQ